MIVGQGTGLTDGEGRLLQREAVQLAPTEARAWRQAARALRERRLRMLIRCDACYEADRPDGTRGEITKTGIDLECRCRTFAFHGETQ